MSDEAIERRLMCPVCEMRRLERKTREQEERYHAMIGDVARQCKHLNQQLDSLAWKRLLVDQFSRESAELDPKLAEYWKRNAIRFMPSLDGSCVVELSARTRTFPKYVATAFIDWLFSWGADRDVKWSDPTIPPVNSYTEEA